MAADRKDQILAAAYEIVGNEGLEGLHARSVAAKVGINHAAVHYYYPKRPDLLVAVTNYALTRFATDRQKLMMNAPNPAAKIEAGLAQAEAYARPNSRFLKNWASFFVAALTDQRVKAELNRHLHEWAAALNVDLQAGSRSGSVKRGSPFMNPELLAATLLGLMMCAHTIGPEFDIGEKLDIVAGSLLA